jgi:hypothetical protein
MSILGREELYTSFRLSGLRTTLKDKNALGQEPPYVIL